MKIQNANLIRKKKNGKSVANISRFECNVLTIFSQYYKSFLICFFYNDYLNSLPYFHDACTFWKRKYCLFMKEILNDHSIEEQNDFDQLFCGSEYHEKLSKAIDDMSYCKFEEPDDIENVLIAFEKRDQFVVGRVVRKNSI